MRKDVTCLHVKSSSPTKNHWTHRLYSVAPTKEHPFKTAIGNCFTYFIEMETVKQIEKTEKWISMERAREKKKKRNRNSLPEDSKQ